MIDSSPEVHPHVLWWNDAAGRWQEVSWGAFCRIRGYEKALSGEDRQGPSTLQEVPAGDHRFIVCYVEEGTGIFVNFIAHRYIFDNNGKVIDTINTMTPEQQEIWDRVYAMPTEPDPETQAKFEAIQAQEFKNLRLEEKMLRSLLSDSPWPINLDADYGFWRAWERHGGPVILGGSKH